MTTVFQKMNELRRPDIAGPDATATTMANQIKQEMTALNEDANSENGAEISKFSDTLVGRLAGNNRFEAVTIAVICTNALWLGYDAEYTATIGKPDDLYQGPVHIIVVEQLFAVYFTFEIFVRLVGTSIKAQLIFDGWFVFDSLLVTLMVLEIWIMPLAGGGLPGFGILRLLRLLRVTRMVKLMRAVPEIMTIVSGLATSVKAVSSVFLLLFLITYTFAIIFTASYHQGRVADGDEGDDLAMVNFGSMGKSFFCLIIMGAIFDDLTYATDSIRSSGSGIMLIVWIIYMLLSGFVMLNMLVGILAEVVNATSDGDKAQKMVDDLTAVIMSIAEEVDQNGDALISASEFRMMQRTESVQSMLKAVDITAEDFEKLGEFAFAHSDAENRDSGKESEMSYGDLVDLICRIRPDVKFGALQFSVFECAMARLLHMMSDGVSALDELSELAMESHLPASSGAESAALESDLSLPVVHQCPWSQVTSALHLPAVARSDSPSSICDERWEQISSVDLIEELRRRACGPPTAPPMPADMQSEAEGMPAEVQGETESKPSSARLPFASAPPPAPRLPHASPRSVQQRSVAAARPPRPLLLAPIPGLDRRLSTEELEKSSSRTAGALLLPVPAAEGTAVSSVVQRPSSASRSRRRPSSAPPLPPDPALAPAQFPGGVPAPQGPPPSIVFQQAMAGEDVQDTPLSDAALAQEVRPEGPPGSADIPFAPFGVPDPDVN